MNTRMREQKKSLPQQTKEKNFLYSTTSSPKTQEYEIDLNKALVLRDSLRSLATFRRHAYQTGHYARYATKEPADCQKLGINAGIR